jgi:ribonucleoside-diphosphate reductase alpha chain
LIGELKAIGLWDNEMLGKLKYHDGSIAEILEIPEEIRAKYKETFEIDMQWLIKAAAERGKWIDQSQSLNIFFKGQSGKDLSDIYFLAWSMGLKTTYYLRTIAASQVEKSTVDTASFGSTHMRKKDETTTNAVGSSNPAASTPSPVSIPEMAALAVPTTMVIEETVMVAAAPSQTTPMVEEVVTITTTTIDTPKKKYNIEVIADAVCEACE